MEMIVNECKWLWINKTDCVWMEMIVNEWELLWINLNDQKGMAMIVNECTWRTTSMLVAGSEEV